MHGIVSSAIVISRVFATAGAASFVKFELGQQNMQNLILYMFMAMLSRSPQVFLKNNSMKSLQNNPPATLPQRPGVVDPSMGSRHLAIAGEWEYPRSRKPHGTGRRPWKKPCRCHIQGYVFTYMTKPHYTHDIFIYTLICFFVGKPFGCPGKRYIYIFYLYAHVHLEFLSYQRSS